MPELTEKLISELIDSVKQVLKREASERLRELYLVGDIDKDIARQLIDAVAHQMREKLSRNGGTKGIE